MPPLAAELVALKPDILLTSGCQATLAASNATVRWVDEFLVKDRDAG